MLANSTAAVHAMQFCADVPQPTKIIRNNVLNQIISRSYNYTTQFALLELYNIIIQTI